MADNGAPALVVQVEGKPEARVFTSRFTIGRDISWADVDLTADTYVSPHHASVYPQADGTWIIEDNGSTNGTWAGGGPLAGGLRIRKAQLEKGAVVRVGRTTITFIPTGLGG